jgi:hypothetical protein
MILIVDKQALGTLQSPKENYKELAPTFWLKDINWKLCSEYATQKEHNFPHTLTA